MFCHGAIARINDAYALGEQVRLVTIENEHARQNEVQPSALAQSAQELARSLARHGVNVGVIGLDAKGDGVGDVLTDDILKNSTDLLVMGAYGHARLKEVVLGGATDTILRDPPGYVLMSR